MPKVLLAVDGSKGALRATRRLIESASWYKEPIEVELLTVQLPLPHVIFAKGTSDRYYLEQGTKALAPSKKLLDKAKILYHPRILGGEAAPTIVEHAEKSKCQMIYMGTRGMTAIANLALGSVATRVVHLAPVPVTLAK